LSRAWEGLKIVHDALGRASALFFQNGVTPFDELFGFLLLLSDALRCSLFILRAEEAEACSTGRSPDISRLAQMLSGSLQTCHSTFCAKRTSTFHNI
jgi:hypothetical protein